MCVYNNYVGLVNKSVVNMCVPAQAVYIWIQYNLQYYPVMYFKYARKDLKTRAKSNKDNT